ncbi:MAG: hypothetical protein RLZZ369_256, partial [Pseudomonadota bacterium]
QSYVAMKGICLSRQGRWITSALPHIVFTERQPMQESSPFDYDGDASLRQPIAQALQKVVDPEVALSIVDVGLVYAVTVTAVKVHVLMTMTSAACPVTDVIIDDVQAELDRVVPADMKIEVEICWEPPWTPDRMSERARQMMQW